MHAKQQRQQGRTTNLKHSLAAVLSQQHAHINDQPAQLLEALLQLWQMLPWPYVGAVV
jgi:hypothetical protein